MWKVFSTYGEYAKIILSYSKRQKKTKPTKTKTNQILDHVLDGSLYSTVLLIFVPVGKLFSVFYNSLMPTKDCFHKKPINFYVGKIEIIYFRNTRTMPIYDQLSMMNIIRMKITYQNKQRRCSVGRPYSIKLFTKADLISTVGQLQPPNKCAARGPNVAADLHVTAGQCRGRERGNTRELLHESKRRCSTSTIPRLLKTTT